MHCSQLTGDDVNVDNYDDDGDNNDKVVRL